ISRLAFEGFRADQPGAGPEVDGARPDGIPGPGVPDAPRSRRRDGKPDLPPVEGPADADIHDDAAAAPERARANPAGDAASVRTSSRRRPKESASSTRSASRRKTAMTFACS